MSEPMSEARLAEIEARVGCLPADETWDAACMGSEGYDIFARPAGGLYVCPPRVARVGYREWPLLAPLAAFIAHSRQDVPDLAREVRRLQAELAAAIDRRCETCRDTGTCPAAFPLAPCALWTSREVAL